MSGVYIFPVVKGAKRLVMYFPYIYSSDIGVKLVHSGDGFPLSFVCMGGVPEEYSSRFPGVIITYHSVSGIEFGLSSEGGIGPVYVFLAVRHD